MANNNNLSAPQLRAMKKSASLGRILQKEFSEIAEDYRNGLSKTKIIEKYNIKALYNIGENVAQNAIASALKGHNGKLGVKTYEGLIPDQGELARLCLEHQENATVDMTVEQRRGYGTIAYERKVGIHALTKKQRKKNSSKGGVIAVDKKLGIHGLSKEQKKAHRRKAIINSGNVPWEDEHKERVFELAKHTDFQCGKKGPSYQKIANQINKELYDNQPIRTRSAINYVLFRASKTKKK
tara:strand:- start:317 stop:1033 length:717 start_codon:yes stop_codon:yes gene_type:complete